MVAESKESYVVSTSVYSIALIMMWDIELPVAEAYGCVVVHIYLGKTFWMRETFLNGKNILLGTCISMVNFQF